MTLAVLAAGSAGAFLDEVEKLLRVDFGELFGAEGGEQIVEGSGGGVAGVGPAAQGDDHPAGPAVPAAG